MFVAILQQLVFFVATQNGCFMTMYSFNDFLLWNETNGGNGTAKKYSDEGWWIYRTNINCCRTIK
jgi:hypothetical protein